MIDVWILVFYIGSATVGGGGPAVVDNLASEEECVKILNELPSPFFSSTKKGVCLKVQKVK